MSRSPRTNLQNLTGYRESWQATMKLLREGRSFSGRERNCAYLNCGGQTFANVSAVTGLDFDDDGRGLAVTDWDHDGDLDLWFLNRTGPRLRLMLNQSSQANPTRADFVAFRLQGSQSNRDAIGARVTLRPRPESGQSQPARAIHQTLSAGDAFLSQSSKWMHFGLGDVRAIDEVIVRWPSGQLETFTGCEPGKRYRLIEGSGRAEPIALDPRDVALTPSEQDKPHLPPTQRIAFASPVPLPSMEYATNADATSQVIANHGRPLLVSLWASWCPPCLAELEQLTKNVELLKREGIDVLALSLDGLDPTQDSTPEDAARLLAQLDFPWPQGSVTRDAVDKLQLLESLLLNRLPKLSVPTNLLITGDGSLAAIYHGPLSPQALITDVRRLTSAEVDPRSFAAPFPGTWNTPPRQLLLTALAREFRERGFEADYARYLALDEQQLASARKLATTAEERQQVDARYAIANFNLGVALVASEQNEAALKHFQRAIDAQPDHTDALINLGVLLAKSGDAKTATAFFMRAVAADPESLAARANLASALSSQGSFVDSLEHFRQALAIQPTHALHSRFARALLETGQYREAARQFERALAINSRDFSSTMALTWLLSTCDDDTVRNGERAVELALRLNTGQTANDPLVLDVLAAAYAEAGEMNRARSTQQQALEQIRTRSPAAQSAFEQRLRKYENDSPYRDSDGKYP